jgi:small subunit ribosomal protein S4
MNKKQKSSANKDSKDSSTQQTQQPARQFKKLSEYGRQLAEKQRVKKMYGMREQQFRNFFALAKKSKDATGSALLVLLERRLDNIVFRLKFASSRSQARQMVVHGHFSVNGVRAFSPSMILKENDVVQILERSTKKDGLMKSIVETALATGTKIPEWLEIDKERYFGRLLRMPSRLDIQATINESFIVELYSK